MRFLTGQTPPQEVPNISMFRPKFRPVLRLIRHLVGRCSPLSANLEAIMSAQKCPAPQVSTDMSEEALKYRYKSQARLAKLAVPLCMMSMFFLAVAVLQTS